MQRRVRERWLVVLFGIGCLLFSYPLLELFNRAELVADIPVTVLYLFGAWFGVIGLTWLMQEWRS